MDQENGRRFKKARNAAPSEAIGPSLGSPGTGPASPRWTILEKHAYWSVWILWQRKRRVEMVKYDPDATREKLVQAAFDEVYHHGLRAASLDGILGRAGVTKGALYHHFNNKKALCQAMLDEVIRPRVVETWVVPLAEADDPITTIQGILKGFDQVSEEQVVHGCPLNNLSQEMSGVDDEFRAKLVDVYDQWHESLREALGRGQANGTVRPDADPDKIAGFLVASLEGAFGMAKNARSVKVLADATRQLVDYLETLRSPN
jgi:AcrR family transcriptional regulator